MPFINGRFYANPLLGRAIERARIAETGRIWPEEYPGLERQGYLEQEPQPPQGKEQDPQQSSDGHWVTINHRHLLIQEKRTGERIARTAEKYKGSRAWAYARRKDNFPAGTNKCNKFVYDVTREAGAEATVVGSDGKRRPPLAAEWADLNVAIPGWRVLGPNEMPQPGDVAAYKLAGHSTYTGHSGIVASVDPDGTVHAIAAHSDVAGPDEKFQRQQGVTFRRYTGGR